MLRKINWEKTIVLAVLASLVFSAIFVIVMLIQSPWETESLAPDARTKGDYSLMLLQCLLGIVAMFLPSMIEHKIKIIIPSKMMIVYALFLYGAIFLGEVQNLYYVIPHWDTILHAFSGAMLGALGFSVTVHLNKIELVELSPAFIAMFSLFFAVTMGVIWEIYEYTFDGILGLNMQKYALRDGTLLTGRDALSDTMKDLTVDLIGASIITISGYISLKYKIGLVERILLKRRKHNEE